MRERKRTQLGSWRDCESQARKRSRNKSCMAEIEEEFEICPQNALLSPRSKIQRCVVPSISLVLETAWAEQAFVCACAYVYECMSKVPLWPLPRLTRTHTHRCTHSALLPLLVRACVSTTVPSDWSREPETRTQHIKNTEGLLWGSACIESEE